MDNYYDLNAIPIILSRFKVGNVIFTGNSDDILKIREYCDKSDIVQKVIDLDETADESLNSDILTELKSLNNYDAIFLNDDANWYTIYNELNIIKDNNNEFPLVFICNNIFPYQRRDSYQNPDMIPNEFLNDFSDKLTFNDISISDGLFYSIDENTPKNGVLTAIEDFLSENHLVGSADIKFINGITILYLKNSISHIRWSKLEEDLKDQGIEPTELSNNIIKNNYLTEYISKFNISKNSSDEITNFKDEISKKDNIIEEYENIIQIHDMELNYKNSQINGLDSKLNLKDTEIRNIESKLNNYENKINTLNNQIDSLKENSSQDNEKNVELNNQLQQANSQIDSLKSEFSERSEVFKNKEVELNNQLQQANSQIDSLKSEFTHRSEYFDKNYTPRSNHILIKAELDKIKHQYAKQLSKLDSKEYCISCFKEEIDNNHLEIEYLKNDSFIKKILNPFAYLYLIIKSNPHELSLNYKLYKAIKNSKCFDIGYYLNKNKDIQESKWCKYFSPELHYVCNGFNEQRRFNKKYFNRNSKKELLNYILTCDK